MRGNPPLTTTQILDGVTPIEVLWFLGGVGALVPPKRTGRSAQRAAKGSPCGAGRCPCSARRSYAREGPGFPRVPEPETSCQALTRGGVYFMPVVLSLFNHKGGVSKTTTTFNLGWKLAQRGRRVLLVDADPQCNLTGTILGFRGVGDDSIFYEQNPRANIVAALEPAYAGRPERLGIAETFEWGPPGLNILAGHIDLSVWEPQLAVSLTTGRALPALSNLPGAVNYLLRTTGEHLQVDLILLDMNPSVSALNETLLFSSDYFIVPTSPDYYCYQAALALCRVLPRWAREIGNVQAADAAYRLPERFPKMLGAIAQRFRPRSGKPAQAFQDWVDRINEAVKGQLVPVLQPLGMVVDEQEYRHVEAPGEPYLLATIADFNSLIAQSQKHNVPVFALTDEQIERQGIVLDTMRKSREAFDGIFEELARVVERLTLH